ncbi:LLM class flavin-dependent oxidoreductase, partial [Mesorhizobium sp. M4B.F.Ca.ET.150.01.1.1]
PAFGRPPLVTATGSPAGIDFAARHSDLVFVTSPGGAHIDSALETLPDHVATIKNRAKAYGRQVKTIINPIIVSRDTEKEAIAYADAIEAGKPQPGTRAFATNNYDSDA